MTERLQKIFSSIPNAKVFADIGCDHGYIAKAMLESGKCEKVIVSDISEKCLNKARELLSENIANGSAESVVSDGFDKVVGADVALIAGMGGEEICNILEKAQQRNIQRWPLTKERKTWVEEYALSNAYLDIDSLEGHYTLVEETLSERLAILDKEYLR